MAMDTLRIGITCYPTFGGSGIIATEIGLELARKGHKIHFICSDAPWRFERTENVFFHEVEPPEYPLFGDSQYALALASKMVEVATWAKLDLFHVHYAIPHAAAGYLARQILGPTAPKLVTTLHGTDITVVGDDRSFLPVTRFSIEQSDGVTVPSQWLKEATYQHLAIDPKKRIEVIPNFVDTDLYSLGPAENRRPLVIHNSNFRPVKRVEDVVHVFAAMRKVRACQLVFIGDGPDRSRVERLVHELGFAGDVTFLGKQLNFVDVMRTAKVFLQPSANESFGLAALEALSCGVPVVSSRVGGVPEVVSDGASGFLLDVGDVEGMAKAAGRLIDDASLWSRMSAQAREDAVTRFRKGPLIDRYESYCRSVLGSSPHDSRGA
jgi:N-acetyl-alpha-D-glucosaminyl L-malate synthase BshA